LICGVFPATYIAGPCAHSDALVAGERGILLCIAPDQRQATVTLNYIEAAFRGSPMLSTLVAGRVSETLRLTNGIEPVRPGNTPPTLWSRVSNHRGLLPGLKGTSTAARRFRDLDRL
jgi:hypothetical protein